MTDSVEDVLGLRDEIPPDPSRARLSKLARSALGFGAAAGFCGLLTLGSGPIRNDLYFWDIPDRLEYAALLSIVTGVVAVLLAVVGAIRIGCAAGRLCGCWLCLWGTALAILGNIVWVVVFIRAIP